MKRIIISVTNDLVTDQRVFKVCNTLKELGFDILLIGRRLPNSLPLERPYKTYRMRLLFNKGFLFYAEYNLRLFFKLLFTKKDVLLANDLDTLLPNYLISKFLNKKLVYDSHELFTELPSVQGRFSQKVWRFLEKWLIPKQKFFFTVSDSIANWYEKKYGIKPLVLKNFPLSQNIPFKESQEKYILYQGALNMGRGLPQLIEAMTMIEDATLKIAGDGPYKSTIKESVILFNVENKVELLGNIQPKKLLNITQNASVGVSLEEGLGLSYKYSLPNKLFDYIQAKTPVAGTYLPEIKKTIETYTVGEIIEDHSPKNIAKVINKILGKGKKFYLKNLEAASKELIWENQTEILSNVFKESK